MKEQEEKDENSLIKCQDEKPKLLYPKAPPKNKKLRNDRIIYLSSNLMNLSFIHPELKIHVYSIEILPEIAKDNYLLQRKIYDMVQEPLNKYFSKKSFAGYNLFGVTSNPQIEISVKTKIEEKEYEVKLKKVSSLDFNDIFDNKGINQKKKSFVEKLVKNILLSSKGTIKFGTDRMVLKLGEDTIITSNDRSRIYKGYYTSAQITESGLYLLVLNMNKYVSGKTMLEKINEIRNGNRDASESEIRELIEEYIEDHKTILTSYGSMRAYRIERIDFDKTPLNTSFNCKNQEGRNLTISIMNYYENQYNVRIKDKNQPLLIAEDKLRKRRLLGNEDISQENEKIIYLVPELVYITGIENNKNSRGRRQDILFKTKMDPNQRMREINKIHDLMNSKEPKQYKRRNGEIITNKSSKQLAEEWGIKLGSNLTLKGRELSQPKLIFDKNVTINPKNGLFRPQGLLRGVQIKKESLMCIYDKRDRFEIKKLLGVLFGKAKAKGLKVDINPENVELKVLNYTNNWNDIKNELNKIHFSHSLEMVLVFLNKNLQGYYNRLKEYLINEIKVDSQFIQIQNVSDPKKGGSIMFNIVDQINEKMGGNNYKIDFYDKNLIEDKVYLIIGLESKRVGKDSIDYVLTFTYNNEFNKTQTLPRTCKDIQEEKEKTLNEMLDTAILVLRKKGYAPHPPNYVIVYRQGGNAMQNLKIKNDEVPIFENYFKNKKEKLTPFREQDTKLIYICCNLKGELKFFEEDRDRFKNPPSGLCVDEKVVQKDKYEFYIQPQYVNQGTATPCHFEVLYQDEDKEHPEKNLPIENLENLTFQLCYYYWTWSGAVRVPGVLKLSTTAIDFYGRCLNHKLNLKDQKFVTPGFI